jgi:hypothetical protein
MKHPSFNFWSQLGVNRGRISTPDSPFSQKVLSCPCPDCYRSERVNTLSNKIPNLCSIHDFVENRYKGRGSVSFNVKKDDLCSEEDEEEEEDEDGDQNNTLQASGQPDSELNKSTAEKRAQSLQRARFARRKRKRRKSQLKGTGGDKVGAFSMSC